MPDFDIARTHEDCHTRTYPITYRCFIIWQRSFSVKFHPQHYLNIYVFGWLQSDPWIWFQIVHRMLLKNMKYFKKLKHNVFLLTESQRKNLESYKYTCKLYPFRPGISPLLLQTKALPLFFHCLTVNNHNHN